MEQLKILTQKPKISLVVFDLGRVLLRITDDWDHAARLAGLPGATGLTGDLSSKAARGGGTSREALAELFDRFEVGRIALDELLIQAGSVSGLAAADVGRVMDAVLVETYPGAVALLDRLRAAGVATACLSNTNARHWNLIADTSHAAHLPLDRLDYAFASQRVGHAKPLAPIYEHVEAETGVDPRHLLFFDDLDENVAAARARGWHAEVVPRCENPVPWMAGRLAAYGVLADDHRNDERT